MDLIICCFDAQSYSMQRQKHPPSKHIVFVASNAATQSSDPGQPGSFTCLRPPLNKKSFPVDQVGLFYGSTRPHFFFFFFF